MISMICAVGKNREIGLNNRLLWDLPQDLEHFRKTTMGKPVVMGQKTFESIGKVLPGRENIILSLDPEFKVEGARVSNSLDDVLKEYKDSKTEVFIIGGASIYKQFIVHADKLYLTLVEDSPEADVYFPDYSEFKNVVFKSDLKEENGVKYKFVELTR